MAGLLGKLLSLAGVICVGLVLGQLLIVGYASSQGWLTKPKLLAMALVAQQTSTAKVEEPPAPATLARQPSLEEILHTRAVHVRNLELREQALASALDQLHYDQKKLLEEKETYRMIRESFQKLVDSEQQGAVAEGRARVREIWEQMKPKQAKEQILQMLAANEEDEVVAILSEMPIAKRAKICAEFSKTAEEAEKLDEILRLIRQGIPEVELFNQTQDKLKQF